MTEQEMYEQDYIICDSEYVKFCKDEAEKYAIEKELAYNDDYWLFNKPSDGLEDNYGEDSMP